MELILCGSWLGRKGFYRAKIEDVKFFSKIEELAEPETLSFIVISYDLAGETLNLKIKKTELPSIILLKVGKFDKIEGKQNSNTYQLSLKDKALKDSEFIYKVKKIKELIEKGTVYQINLTNRLEFNFNGDPKDLFFNFYKSQPVPYAFFLDLEEFFIISGSMELFLEKKGETLISKPIKGTSKSLKSLKNSLKDKAENLMITDMIRNDIGRIAHFGSVKVTELFKITKYKTLYQMHSTVEGKTSHSISSILKETFPPASVTGAPKRKAVEIIDTLETHVRGYYCGCAGLIWDKSNFILSVLIRTAVGRGNQLSYYAGCGIVWDSDPEKELNEKYLKIKAFYHQV